MGGHTPGTEQMRCGLDCVGYNIIGKCWSRKYICASVTFTIISQGFINLALFLLPIESMDIFMQLLNQSPEIHRVLRPYYSPFNGFPSCCFAADGKEAAAHTTILYISLVELFTPPLYSFMSVCDCCCYIVLTLITGSLTTHITFIRAEDAEHFEMMRQHNPTEIRRGNVEVIISNSHTIHCITFHCPQTQRRALPMPMRQLVPYGAVSWRRVDGGGRPGLSKERPETHKFNFNY